MSDITKIPTDQLQQMLQASQPQAAAPADISQIPTEQLHQMLQDAAPEQQNALPPISSYQLSDPAHAAEYEQARKNNPSYIPPHLVGSDFKWSQVPGRLANIAEGVRSGFGFNQLDKADAALNSLIPGKNFGDYGANLAEVQKINAPPDQTPQGQSAYKAGQAGGVMISPVTKALGVGVDALLPTTGEGVAGIAQRYGNYAAQGGVFNTLYQAAMGDENKAKQGAEGAGLAAGAGMVAPEGGSIGDALLGGAKNFAKGAAMGVAPAAVLEGGQAILGTVLKPIALSLGVLSPEEEAVAKIGQAASRADLSPEQLASKVGKLGDAGMLANVGGPVTDYARDVAQFPGEARATAQTAFARQQGSRLATEGGAVGRIEDALGSTLSDQSAIDTAKGLIQQRTEDSGPIWKDLFSEPVIPQSSKLDVLAKNKVVQRAMSGGQATATNFANSVGEDLAPEAFAANGKPTLQGWHAVTSDLGQTISDVKRGVIPTPPDASLASLEALHHAIMGELKNEAVNPLATKFEDALNTWSGPSAALDAMRMGAKVARGDARLTQQLVDDMSDSEREFFRIGLADQAQYLVSKTPDGANVVKGIFGNQNQRRNLEAAFDSRADFNRFRKAIAVDQKFYTSKQAVLGGSDTATKLIGTEESESPLGEVAKGALEDAKEGGATGVVAGLAKKGWNYLKGNPEAVRDAAGRMLFTADPAKKAEVLAALLAQYNKGPALSTAGMKFSPQAGVLAAKFGGM